MRFCLSNRQSYIYLKKADEIKIEQRDYQAIPEYMEKYPGKTLIIDMDNNPPVDLTWELIKTYADAYDGTICCALANKEQMTICKLHEINFYYKYQINTFYELQALKEYGVSYVLIGAPLVFDLKNVARYNIPIRVIPNVAYEPYLDHQDGIIGQWIRPEDVDKYEQYVAVLEFYAPKALEKEAALFRVYAEQKQWPGNLNLLIDNLGIDASGRFYDEDNFAIRRMNCRQKCISGKTCRYCYDQFNTKNLVRKYLDYKKELI